MKAEDTTEEYVLQRLTEQQCLCEIGLVHNMTYIVTMDLHICITVNISMHACMLIKRSLGLKLKLA